MNQNTKIAAEWSVGFVGINDQVTVFDTMFINIFLSVLQLFGNRK